MKIRVKMHVKHKNANKNTRKIAHENTQKHI